MKMPLLPAAQSRLGRSTLCLCATVCAVAGTSGAMAADAPAGYVGQGTLSVRAPLPGATAPIEMRARLDFEQRAGLFRVDVLDISLVSAQGAESAMVRQIVPTGGISLVFDRHAKEFFVWSPGTRRYYASTFPPTPSTTASPATAPTPSPPPNPFAFERMLRTLTAFNFSVALAGHGTVDGHPATGLAFVFSQTDAKGHRVDMHSTVQFADDLDGVPVELTADVGDATMGTVSLRADATQIVKRVPASGDFAVPGGYTRAGSPVDVLRRAGR